MPRYSSALATQLQVENRPREQLWLVQLNHPGAATGPFRHAVPGLHLTAEALFASSQITPNHRTDGTTRAHKTTCWLRLPPASVEDLLTTTRRARCAIPGDEGEIQLAYHGGSWH